MILFIEEKLTSNRAKKKSIVKKARPAFFPFPIQTRLFTKSYSPAGARKKALFNFQGPRKLCHGRGNRGLQCPGRSQANLPFFIP
ncbi:Hypothetical protein Minf_2279 [Methylacidiphilum infernorum V4]|uniref:Uncharacterized protein n=1 Tax=Methylacidiphilum infernorum (isolate V4) TaxID=481448 RepID=B3E0A4_METI4|nr:Hypothetical protein Minf_2279 [Methylacidiphilum infernorum V4]